MAQEMTSRERAYAALNHQEPDRVPICFGGTLSATNIVECAPEGRVCSDLYSYLGITGAEPIKIGDICNVVVNLDERVMQRLHSDFRNVTPSEPPAVVQPDGTKIAHYFCGAKIKRIGYYDEYFGTPMRYMTTKKDIDEYPSWPEDTNDFMEGVVERARYLHEETDYFVVGESYAYAFPFNGYGILSGMDKWLTDIKIRPKFYHQLCEKMMEVAIQRGDKFYSAVGKYLDGALMFDDLGTQQGGLMSHDDFAEFYKPYTAEIIRNIRKHLRPEAKIIIHCCGSIYSYIPDLIEIGVDVLNPVQPLARNTEPWRLKQEFGKQIAFLGGFDIQKLLPLGSVERVEEGAKKLIQEYAPGGGFIFAASHNIEPDTPPENIVAMFDTAYEYGKYPIPRQSGLNFVDYITSLNLR